MLRQLQIFLPKFEEAAGKISAAMSKSIKQQQKISMVDLVAPKLQAIQKSRYTTKDENGTESIDADLKARFDKIQERLDNKAADDYSKFVNDWGAILCDHNGTVVPGH